MERHWMLRNLAQTIWHKGNKFRFAERFFPRPPKRKQLSTDRENSFAVKFKATRHKTSVYWDKCLFHPIRKAFISSDIEFIVLSCRVRFSIEISFCHVCFTLVVVFYSHIFIIQLLIAASRRWTKLIYVLWYVVSFIFLYFSWQREANCVLKSTLHCFRAN